MEEKTKKGRVLVNKLLIPLLGAAVVVYVVASFVSGVSLVAQAEVSSPGSMYNLYLLEPDTSSAIVPVIEGQYEFIINITPSDIDASINLSILGSDGPIPLHCIDQYKDHDNIYHIVCDSMNHENDAYMLVVNAVDSEGVGLEFSNNEFGPIFLNNIYRIEIPSVDGIVSGEVELLGILPGEVQNVTFGIGITASDPMITLDATKIEAGPRLYEWSAPWNTELLDNGHYSVVMNITTLNGTYISNVFTTFANVQNSTIEECIPIWTCGSWSDNCINGMESRNCYDTNNCGDDTSKPDTSQTCVEENTLLSCIEILWSCSIWSECMDGVQTRECTHPDCPSAEGMPPTSQTCTTTNTNTNGEELIANTATNTNTNTTTNTNTNGEEPIANTNTINSSEKNASSQVLPPPDDFVPPVIVLNIPEGGLFKGIVELSATVTGEEVQDLEFLYDDVGGRTNIYAVSGEKDGNKWIGYWDTQDIKTGQYDMFARVTALHGEKFVSGKVRISIENETSQKKENTDPPKCNDADGDKLCDDDEIEFGFDPNIFNPYVEIVKKLESIQNVEKREKLASIIAKFHDDPLTSNAPLESLKLVNVFNIKTIEEGNKIVFTGQGPPNSYITLFIYSEPLVVITQTDADGNFIYTLDKDLLDGKHEVYATVTNDTGKIIQQSQPFSFFVREARAVSEDEYMQGYVDVGSGSDQAVRDYAIIAMLVVLGGFFIYVLFRLVQLNKVEE
ncbi:Ig-like domain-containing protein [Patescibacteria group bacterium]